MKNLSPKILAIIFSFLLVLSCASCSEQATPKEPVDIDLTQLSATLISAEVTNMINSPERYQGKTVRISGEVGSNYYEPTATTYHYIVLYGPDKQPCCNQNIEFVVSDNAYPRDGAVVTISGVYKPYTETVNDAVVTYYHINPATIE